MTIITKHTTIMKIMESQSGLKMMAFHRLCDEDEADSEEHYFMNVGLWEDLGAPVIITVSIEPGDKLNDDN